MIYFITGNTGKFDEAKAVIPELEQLDINLPEIQSLDPKEIIKAKLMAASEVHDGDFVVEDTSLCLECFGGLPGPFIKWFEKSLGNEGIADLVSRYQNSKAIVRVIVGYKSGEVIEFFEGTIDGDIVIPRGNLDFGWGPIFQPKGETKTFAEMTPEEKSPLNMRRIAFEKLKNYLNNETGTIQKGS